MRRTAGAVLVTVAALAATTAVSWGGEATVAPNGDFLMMDADFSSAVAGTKAKPRPTTLKFHHMFGNYRDGSTRGGTDVISVRTPRGMTTNSGLVATCPLPASTADVKADRCPAASRVGTGTALADARSFGVADPVPATVTAYNGAEHNGNPTFILQGVAKIGANNVITEFDFENRKATGKFGSELRTFDAFAAPPPDPNAPGIALNKLDLAVGKTINTRVGGKRVKRGYIETPTTCPASGWAFEEEFTFVNATSLKAPDVMACTK
jgi:hypothetical protein